jgi:hypothetical protein
MLGWWGLLDEPNRNAQGDQPQVQAGRKGRGADIIIEDAVVIETDPFRQPIGDESPPPHQLISLGVGLGPLKAGQAINFQPTKL